jgi:hypothetical protein
LINEIEAKDSNAVVKDEEKIKDLAIELEQKLHEEFHGKSGNLFVLFDYCLKIISLIIRFA